MKHSSYKIFDETSNLSPNQNLATSFQGMYDRTENIYTETT